VIRMQKACYTHATRVLHACYTRVTRAFAKLPVVGTVISPLFPNYIYAP